MTGGVAQAKPSFSEALRQVIGIKSGMDKGEEAARHLACETLEQAVAANKMTRKEAGEFAHSISKMKAGELLTALHVKLPGELHLAQALPADIGPCRIPELSTCSFGEAVSKSAGKEVMTIGRGSILTLNGKPVEPPKAAAA